MNEAERRGYKKVVITEDVGGWPVGSYAWHDPDTLRDCWNEDCTKYWSHTLGYSCEYVEESKMKLEVGKYYEQRNGEVVGPMHLYGKTSYGYDALESNGELWRVSDGACYPKSNGNSSISDHDLIREVQVGTLAELGVREGYVVQHVDPRLGHGDHIAVEKVGGWYYSGVDGFKLHPTSPYWRIISRAESATSPVRNITTRTVVNECVIGHVEVTKQGKVWMRHVSTRSDLTAAIETLTQIRDAMEGGE